MLLTSEDSKRLAFLRAYAATLSISTNNELQKSKSSKKSEMPFIKRLAANKTVMVIMTTLKTSFVK